MNNNTVQFVDFNGALRGFSHSIFCNIHTDDLSRTVTWHRGNSTQEYIDFSRDELKTNPFFKVAFVVNSHRRGDGLNDNLNLDLFDMIFVFDREIVDSEPMIERLNYLKKLFNNDNVRFVTGDYSHDDEAHPHVLKYPAMLFYSNRNNELQAMPATTRPYYFDALMGYVKPHRKILFEMLTDSDMLDKSLVNITTNKWFHDLQNIYRSSELDSLEDNSVVEQFKNSVFDSYENYQGNYPTLYTPSVSQMIPWSVYHASWYSLVTETWPDSYHFFTEKTAKPLFAKRPFFMFGTCGMLKKLRSYGFCTFGAVFDESYDSIEDNTLRYQTAYFEAKRIALDYHAQDVYHTLRPELEFNHYLILDNKRNETPLKEFIINSIREVLDK